jgi:uncharacterized protein (DUF1697 family)
VVRTAAQIQRAGRVEPLPSGRQARPKLLHVHFLVAAPEPAAVERVHTDELTCDVVRIIGDDMYVDYVDAVHGSKLTPAYFGRRLGVEGTARNWRTVLALAEMTA